MKIGIRRIVLSGLVAGLVTALFAQQADTPNVKKPEEATRAEVAKPAEKTAGPAEEKPVLTPPGPEVKANRPGVTVTKTADGKEGYLLNFRGVPLEMVLNYLSEAAGFVIILETKLEGKVDMWSNQPLSKDGAVNVLNTVLNKNGYAAIRNDQVLTIVNRDEAKKREIPVRSGSDPESIPKSDEMVTQILPVRYANATQLTKDLLPLLPSHANMTANESGNALVITDTQSSIRRMAEIVKALDTSIASISAIRVFPLQYADAKELATVVKELFDTSSNTQRGGGAGGGGGGGLGGGAAQLFARFGGGGGAGGGGGGGRGGAGGADASGDSAARKAASRVVAVADERTNSLVVSAPDEFIPTIEQLVREIDTNVTEVTEVRVFRLKNSDPQEMADILSGLFPDDSKTDSNNAQVQFNRGGPFGGGGGGRGGANAAATSTRNKKQGRVIAVPDQRTASVIVSAAKQLMGQIEEMVAQLDSNPAKKQKVFVYSLENADVQSVEEILRGMFEGQNSRNNRSTTRQNTTNPLNNRTTGNTGGNTGGGFGGGGGGGGAGGGGTRGGGGF